MLEYIWIGLVLVVLTGSYWRLRHIPGPFVAKFTDLWRLITVWGRNAHNAQLNLHDQLGDVVRIGPNCVSIRMPDVIDTIYGIQKGYIKSDFYKPWHNIVNGRRAPSPVFQVDEVQHAKQKRHIASAYQLSKLKDFEVFVDSTTAAFFKSLDEICAKPRGALNLGEWLQFYAFDVIGELTFSKRLGFLERGEDVEGIMSSIAWNFERCSVLGQMPWIDYITWKNPVYLKFFAKQRLNPIMEYGQRRMLERLSENGSSSENEPSDMGVKDPELAAKLLKANNHSKSDFLAKFLAARNEGEDAATDGQVLAYLFMNINAGSDTIATTLRAAFYYLLKNPETLRKLIDELDTAVEGGRISKPFVTWSEAQTLPYTNAVIKEALRLHPALGLVMERVVPEQGLRLPDADGTFLPAGTVVGVNPWVLHRDERIFGKDARQWNPDRWLTGNSEQVKYMEHHMLSFGAGKRSCLGRNIAMLEMCKIVPAMLLRYDLRLARPEKEWRLINAWVVRQEGLDVEINRR